jgi:hypothetical protein
MFAILLYKIVFKCLIYLDTTTFIYVSYNLLPYNSTLMKWDQQ